MPPTKVIASASARNWKRMCGAVRAQRFLHADLARALGHRDQHDVHQANAADPQRERADEASRTFSPT